jgi:hypothetical protein
MSDSTFIVDSLRKLSDKKKRFIKPPKKKTIDRFLHVLHVEGVLIKNPKSFDM